MQTALRRLHPGHSPSSRRLLHPRSHAPLQRGSVCWSRRYASTSQSIIPVIDLGGYWEGRSVYKAISSSALTTVLFFGLFFSFSSPFVFPAYQVISMFFFHAPIGSTNSRAEGSLRHKTIIFILIRKHSR